MKIFKRLIILCLVFSFLCTPALAYDAGTLKYLGAVPEGVTDSTIVTRELLSYSLAKVLMPNAVFDKTVTAFTDVEADNPYSGYIKYISERGIMNGSGNGLFNPKNNVTINELSTVLVKALGYGIVAEAKGGWPGGYTAVAASLKLYSGADISDSTVTYGSLKTILLNFLAVPVPKEQIYTQDGNYELALSTSKDALLYAEKNLDLYEYEGRVTDIDWEKYQAYVTFSRQNSNDSKYGEGDTERFSVSPSLNIAVYENIPVRLVIYNDDMIVDAVPEKGINIKYGVVDSVNNETSDSYYNVNYINTLTLTDDENNYTFSDDCSFYVNGSEFNGKLSLMNKYVKIIEKDEEIVHLSYDNLCNQRLPQLQKWFYTQTNR